MKLVIFAILSLLSLGQAVTPALYLHHERSSQATVEADCQNRELCLDKVNLAPLGRFNDGTLFHLVSQEKPNVSLSGTLAVTGGVTLANNLTLSLIPTGRIPYTTTSGLVTSASTLAYNGTTLAVNDGTYSGTLGVTGAITGSSSITTTAATGFVHTGVAGAARDVISMQTSGVNRWIIRNSGGTESGSDAGSAFQILARTDAGAGIDVPIDITRASGGAITLARPVTISNLAGTGTRLTTSTSTGVQGNATTIAGANTWSDKQTHTTAPRFNSATASEFLLLDGSKDLTSVAGNGTGNVVRTTSPTLVTPALGAATATTIALGGNEAFTYDEGTFTAAATGMSACAQGSLSGSTCTGTASYVRVGKQVTVSVPNLYGTSNSTACYITGVPAAISPAAVVNQVSVDGIYDNGNNHVGIMSVGLVANEFRPYFRTSLTSPVNSTFTNSGTKGFIAFTITYNLQ